MYFETLKYSLYVETQVCILEDKIYKLNINYDGPSSKLTHNLKHLSYVWYIPSLSDLPRTLRRCSYRGQIVIAIAHLSICSQVFIHIFIYSTFRLSTSNRQLEIYYHRAFQSNNTNNIMFYMLYFLMYLIFPQIISKCKVSVSSFFLW